MSATDTIPETAREAPPKSKKAVSSSEAIHEPSPAMPPTKFLSDVVRDVIKAWDDNKNFTPQQIHDKAMEFEGELTSRSKDATQQTIIQLRKDGLIERVARGRYIKKTKANKPLTAKKAAARKTGKAKEKAAEKPKKAAKPTKAAAKKAAPAPVEEPIVDVPAEIPDPPLGSNPVIELDFNDVFDMMAADLSIEGAFDLYSDVIRQTDTHSAEFWHLFGTMCATHDKMAQVVADEKTR